jgi:cytochrome P450
MTGKTVSDLSAAELGEQLLSYADDIERQRQRARHAPAVMREAARRLAPATLAAAERRLKEASERSKG